MNKVKKFEICENSPSAFVIVGGEVIARDDGTYSCGTAIISAKNGDNLTDALLDELAKVPT